MMDNFKEDVVSSRNRLLPNILYVVSWVMIVLFGVYAMLLLQVVFYDFNVSALIMTVASAALAVFLVTLDGILTARVLLTTHDIDALTPRTLLRSKRRRTA